MVTETKKKQTKMKYWTVPSNYRVFYAELIRGIRYFYFVWLCFGESFLFVVRPSVGWLSGQKLWVPSIQDRFYIKLRFSHRALTTWAAYQDFPPKVSTCIFSRMEWSLLTNFRFPVQQFLLYSTWDHWPPGPHPYNADAIRAANLLNCIQRPRHFPEK